jgi:acyl carrier protein
MDINLELIKDYIARHADNPPENLTLESKLNEIGIDSLGILELVFELEDKYGIRLPEDIPIPQTVGQFLELIAQHKPAALNE